MRWLYVVMLSDLRVKAGWLESRDCHVNVNIIEIAYRLQVTMATVHKGPRCGEGVLDAGRGAIILCHDDIFEFGVTTMLSKTIAKAMFSVIAATKAFLKWLPCQQNIGCHNASTEDLR